MKMPYDKGPYKTYTTYKARDNLHFEIETKRIANQGRNYEKPNMRNNLTSDSIRSGVQPTNCKEPIPRPAEDRAARLQTGLRK